MKKSDLDPALVAAAEADPVVLPAWDPMGALATLRAPTVDGADE